MKTQSTPTPPQVGNGTVDDDLSGEAESGSASGDEDDTGEVADATSGTTEQRSDSADVEDNDVNEDADKDIKELESQMNRVAIDPPEEPAELKGMFTCINLIIYLTWEVWLVPIVCCTVILIRPTNRNNIRLIK